MLTTKRPLLFTALTLALVACGGESAPHAPTASEPAIEASPGANDCTEQRTGQKGCGMPAPAEDASVTLTPPASDKTPSSAAAPPKTGESTAAKKLEASSSEKKTPNKASERKTKAAVKAAVPAPARTKVAAKPQRSKRRESARPGRPNAEASETVSALLNLPTGSDKTAEKKGKAAATITPAKATNTTAAPAGKAKAEKVPAVAPKEQKERPAAKPLSKADAIAAKVDSIYEPVKHFVADFEQTFTAKIAGRKKVTRGVIKIRRPNQVSFSYAQPNKNRIVSDGKVLKIYEHDSKQMFTKPVANTEYPGALAFIMGKGLLASFTFTLHPSAKYKGGYVLVGKPRKANPSYKAVLFYIDQARLEARSKSCIRRVLVLDAQGNKNRFDFLRVTEPASMAPDTFAFTPPKGTVERDQI